MHRFWISPRRSWSSLCLGFLLCLVAISSSAAQETVRPNIVLVFADDLGISDLACYGRAEHNTPRLDALATEGMLFRCAYTAQPICSPSRAALMTGKYPARLHLTNYLPGRADANTQRMLQPIIEGQLPTEEVTIAELLRDAGYATGIFGKWHLGGGRFGPAAQGFDTVFLPPGNSQPTDTEGGKSEMAITMAAEAFIEAHRDEPFFCYVPHHTPHIPLGAQPEREARYGDRFHPTYAAMIDMLDECVGRLIDKVDQLGLKENTIFIFTSDNGGLHVLEFPGNPPTHCRPFRAGKGYLYEGGLREPLIVRWPATIAAGTECDQPVVLTDLVPTLLLAAGVDPARTVGPLDGRSILPLWKGEPLADRDLYWHFPNYTNQGGLPGGAIRSGRWKLIEFFEDDRLELYDLLADPSETTNVAAAQADVTADLHAKLRTWRERVGAQMMRPNPNFDEAAHHALYVDPDPSSLIAEATAAATEPLWQEWRAAMNVAVQGRRGIVTPAQGDVRLMASEANVHGERLRYEPESFKNVLGYWTNVDDWAEWDFEVPAAGKYEIEVLQGCGDGSGGAEVAIEINGERLTFVVQETGHFQSMIQRTIGEVELPAGPMNLAVRPQSKPGVAVMDLRRVVLRPLP
ncbi:MAG: sulfatase-like hydrolase/transferase [Planctomycetales bacterium]|nr:sulfatase-like hydrolase/transferase [Planctomycetales bacterium]